MLHPDARTLLDLMGINEHIGSGTSRHSNIVTRQPIPEHDSFAIDLHGATAAVKRKDFVFLKSEKSTHIYIGNIQIKDA